MDEHMDKIIHTIMNSADDRQEGIWADDMIFLLIVFFSNNPEKYISSGILNPLTYYESTYTGTRSYNLDGLMTYYDRVRQG